MANPICCRGRAHVLSFNSVVTRKFLTSAPGTDRPNFLAVTTHTPTRDVQRSCRSLPIDGVIKPPVVSIFCTRDLLTESTRAVSRSSKNRRDVHCEVLTGCEQSRLNCRRADPIVVRANSHVQKAGAFQVRLDLLRRGVLRHVGRTICGRERAVIFEDFPAAIRAKIDVVHVNSTSGSQRTKRL